MTFNYTICYPDREKIELKDAPISGDEVLEIARNYQWLEQLQLLNTLDFDKVHYNPSLEFIHINNQRAFTLTANYNDQMNLEFSLWYKRPKKVKVLFGLLGETEKMKVDEAWSYSLEKSIEYLELFTSGNYRMIERLYEK